MRWRCEYFGVGGAVGFPVGQLGVTSGGGAAHSPGNTQPAAKQKDQRGPCPDKVATTTVGHHPIELGERSETLALTLFQLPGEMGLGYSMYYTSPRGWHDNLGYWLDTRCMTGGGSGSPTTNVIRPPGGGNPPPCTQINFYRPDGAKLVFSGTPGTVGAYPVQGGSTATLTENADGTYTLHDEDGTTQTYSSGGALESIKDTSGIGWTINHPTGLAGTTTVTATDGQSFSVTKAYATVNGQTIWTVTVIDPAGNHYTYSYVVTQHTSLGHNAFELLSLTLPGSPSTTVSYKYSSGAGGLQSLLTEEDYNGAPYFYIGYDSNGYPIDSHEANGNRDFSIVYTLGSGGGTLTAAVTNPLGYTTIKQFGTQYGGEFLLTSVSGDAVADCGATTRSYAYDSNGDLSQSVDNNGVTHTYSYAANGLLQTETEAAGTAAARTTDYTWDPNPQLDRLLGVKVNGVAKTAYTYDAHNRLASVTLTNLMGYGQAALTTSYAYTQYADGVVQSMTVTSPSPNGTDKTTYQYDTHGNLTSVTDGLGHVTTYSGYNALGEVGTIVGPNGAEVDYTYDARGRVATKTTHPNGGTATWTYAYDGFGLLASVTAPDGEVTTWTRDQAMRVTAITHNDKDGTSTEAFTYDANNDVTADVISRGGAVAKSSTYAYDALGRVYQAKGANGQVLTYAYDGNGNVLSVTDALGHTTHHAYDALDRVTATTNPANDVTHFDYDQGDHVVKVTDPRGLVTTYSYDGFGQLLKQVSPDTGTTTLAYDAYGRLASKTRADGTQVSYAYDAINRLTSATAGSATRTYTWDACTHGIGRLCAAAVNGQSSVDVSYTPQGQVAARSISISNGPVYTLGYGYDNMGHLTELQYPDGNEALYDYTRGAVADVRVKIGSATTYAASGVSYLPMDLGMTGWNSANGLGNSLAYDGDLRLTSISVPNVESLAFSYNAANEIIGITNGLDNAASQSLSYDADGRLTGVSSGVQTASYSFDADGNRIAQVINGTSTNFSYATASNQLTATSGGSSASYGYDADGSTTMVNGSTAYGYGPFGALTHASGAGFTISAAGQRLAKTFGGNTTYFAPGPGGSMLAEDDAGSWVDYVWLNGRLVSLVKAGSVYSIHDDQTGRPIAVTAPSSQAVVWAATGLPFDRQVTANTFGAFNIGFPGQYFDSEDGLYHNGARDYDAAHGRFIESDPIGLAGGVNTYAYVGDNPLSNVDPLGLSWGDDWSMFWSWALGTAPPSTVYGPGTDQSNDMMTSPGVLAAVKAYDSKNSTGCNRVPLTNYDYNFGLKGLWDAGLNPTQQFVGSYSVNVYPASNGQISIYVYNTTSLRSASYHVWPNAWNPSNGSPMGNASQVYVGTMPDPGLH
jgi:RHS repeat-associated protein